MTSSAFDITGLNCFSIRKERKTYGLKQRFEGIVDEDLPVLIVDDLCNEGEAIIIAKRHLEEANLKLYKNAFTVVSNDDFKEFEVDSIHKKYDFHCSLQSYQLNKSYEENIKKLG